MADARRTGVPRTLRWHGFTLVELLVVMAMVGLLTSILLPATAAARREARAVRCQSNMRQLLLAVSDYCAEAKGKYPTNLLLSQQAWFDSDRVGGYLPPLPIQQPPADSTVWVCPEDDGARRSYTMNYWASSNVDFVPTPALGERWGPGCKHASRMLLLAESWSNTGFPAIGYSPQFFIGASGDPGKRFGGAGGMNPPLQTRIGPANSEVTFWRHRRSGARGVKTQPIGRTVIGFADSHVELLSNEDLLDASGKLTGRCVWSPYDLR